jgi:hypothetical protein
MSKRPDADGYRLIIIISSFAVGAALVAAAAALLGDRFSATQRFVVALGMVWPLAVGSVFIVRAKRGLGQLKGSPDKDDEQRTR